MFRNRIGYRSAPRKTEALMRRNRREKAQRNGLSGVQQRVAKAPPNDAVDGAARGEI
jgi:hypothetical protein